MPKHYPTWPAAQQVQDYLEAYVDKHNLKRLMRFHTRVERADPTKDGWEITSKNTESGKVETEEYDHLVVCTGTFSRGKIPEYEGKEEFTEAGERSCTPAMSVWIPRRFKAKTFL